MKKINFITWLFIAVLSTEYLAAQPANETNCFRSFEVTATGRNDVNAYLLSQLAYLVYADQLSTQVGVSAATLQNDNSIFKTEFVKRTKHFFYDPSPTKTITTITSRIEGGDISLREPQFDFVTANDASGIDPEVMLISTPTAVYVVARGTDRVAGTKSDFDYEWGEWLKTDALAFFQSPCPGCEDKGMVHRGFREALHYGNATSNYINTLTEKIKTMVGTSGKKVWITGHSLGGALAQLIGFYLKQYKNITAQQLVLFASPHVGDPK